jgi:hypothetical protein
LPRDDFDDELEEAWDDPTPEPTPLRGWIIEAVIVLALASPALIWLVVTLFGSRQ